MSPLAPFPCAKTDAVLALHLDGDLAAPRHTAPDEHGYTFVDNETLHAHLRECPSCQTTLRRARRLDALLATTAGASRSLHENRPGSSWPALQDRWFAALDGRALATPAGAATGRTPGRHGARLAAIAAGVAIAIAIAWSWPGRRGPAAADDVVHHALAPTPAAALVRMPAPAPGNLIPAADAVRHLRRQQATSVGAGAAPQTLAAPTSQLAAWVADAARPPADRLAATRALLAGCRSFAPDAHGAFRALLMALAASGDFGTAPFVHAQQLDLLRDSACARSLLATRLVELDVPGEPLPHDGSATLMVAARLGGEANDRLVRRVVRRHPHGVELVAAALRCGVRQAGGARLLLDLWQDLGSRGLVATDADTARAWFGAQPGSLFAEVERELADSRANQRRQHCLLALGVAADGSTLPTLLAHAQSRHHDEAHTAAFAMSCLPRATLAPLVPLAMFDEAFLLRAALARADHPAAKPWLEALSLRPAERRDLHEASLSQFPEVASWFRQRGAASD